jgi:hypothetical protein
MGKLVYAGTTEIGFEDRVLAHLQIVIGLKLRRKEGFFFSWRDDQASGTGAARSGSTPPSRSSSATAEAARRRSTKPGWNSSRSHRTAPQACN